MYRAGPPLDSGITGAGVLNLNGGVTVFGGIETVLPHKDVWRLDPETRVWEKLEKALKMSHISGGIAAVPKDLFKNCPA